MIQGIFLDSGLLEDLGTAKKMVSALQSCQNASADRPVDPNISAKPNGPESYLTQSPCRIPCPS